MKKFHQILNEIATMGQQIDPNTFNRFLNYITKAKHIFVAGAGRSGLMINAFANRLLHLGYSVSIVGEISSPHSQPADLLIISSGSGETLRLIEQAKLAKANQVNIALITSNIASSLAKLADCVITIPSGMLTSIQPMGSLFEQTSLILTDSMVLCLMAQQAETSQSMKARHADIE